MEGDVSVTYTASPCDARSIALKFCVDPNPLLFAMEKASGHWMKTLEPLVEEEGEEDGVENVAVEMSSTASSPLMSA